MATSASLTINHRADRFCYPESLQPLIKIDIHSTWRNKFISAWTNKNATIADQRHFPEIVEKAIEGENSLLNLFSGSIINSNTNSHF